MKKSRSPMFIMLALLLAPQGCGFKSRSQLESEASAREYHAGSSSASCWERAEGFKTTRAGYYAMAPQPEGLAYAGPVAYVIIPAVGIATLVMGIFTVPYDLVAVPFRCMRKKD